MTTNNTIQMPFPMNETEYSNIYDNNGGYYVPVIDLQFLATTTAILCGPFLMIYHNIFTSLISYLERHGFTKPHKIATYILYLPMEIVGFFLILVNYMIPFVKVLILEGNPYSFDMPVSIKKTIVVLIAMCAVMYIYEIIQVGKDMDRLLRIHHVCTASLAFGFMMFMIRLGDVAGAAESSLANLEEKVKINGWFNMYIFSTAYGVWMHCAVDWIPHIYLLLRKFESRNITKENENNNGNNNNNSNNGDESSASRDDSNSSLTLTPTPTLITPTATPLPTSSSPTPLLPTHRPNNNNNNNSKSKFLFNSTTSNLNLNLSKLASYFLWACQWPLTCMRLFSNILSFLVIGYYMKVVPVTPATVFWGTTAGLGMTVLGVTQLWAHWIYFQIARKDRSQKEQGGDGKSGDKGSKGMTRIGKLRRGIRGRGRSQVGLSEESGAVVERSDREEEVNMYLKESEEGQSVVVLEVKLQNNE
jgi:uncharacterized membrane protein